MATEVMDALGLHSGDVYVDGTLGLGGHAALAAELVSPNGKVYGFDWDETMLAEARSRLSDKRGVEFIFVHRDYRGIGEEMERAGERANGILLDLGLNSAQIDDPSRGIAFREEGPLDMRMDRSQGEPAAALLNRWSPNEIEQVLWEFGDERWARAIARKIVERRKVQPLRTTTDLVDCVLAAIPVGARDKRIHPATRTFQAIRIAVNRELEALDQAIEGAANALKPNGTLVVLSYHSGEDRPVKQAMRKLAGEGFQELYRKPIVPSEDEIRRNPRSRSAKMRAVRRAAMDGKGDSR